MNSNPPSVAAEIRQSRPFRSVGQEVALTLIRTTAVLERWATETIGPSGLSLPQYNVLRILRGAGDQGLGTSAIRERMLDLNPGVTRLVDRLVAGGYVTRDREPGDRRGIRCRITPAGLALLQTLDPLVDGTDDQLVEDLSPEEQRTLVRLLDLVRHSAARRAAER